MEHAGRFNSSRPHCREPQGLRKPEGNSAMSIIKSIFKWSVIGLIVLFALVGCIAVASDTEEIDERPKADNSAAEKYHPPKQETIHESNDPEPSEPEPAPAPEPEEPELSSGQENALRSAEQYLNTMPFSKSGLVEQLEYEGYSTGDAQFAVNQLDVNWNDQAVRSAEQYLETMPFSEPGLIEQLEYEGYSASQARHGARQVL